MTGCKVRDSRDDKPIASPAGKAIKVLSAVASNTRPNVSRPARINCPHWDQDTSWSSWNMLQAPYPSPATKTQNKRNDMEVAQAADPALEGLPDLIATIFGCVLVAPRWRTLPR